MVIDIQPLLGTSRAPCTSSMGRGHVLTVLSDHMLDLLIGVRTT
jgi:hypothetical protein